MPFPHLAYRTGTSNMSSQPIHGSQTTRVSQQLLCRTYDTHLVLVLLLLLLPVRLHSSHTVLLCSPDLRQTLAKKTHVRTPLCTSSYLITSQYMQCRYLKPSAAATKSFPTPVQPIGTHYPVLVEVATARACAATGCVVDFGGDRLLNVFQLLLQLLSLQSGGVRKCRCAPTVKMRVCADGAHASRTPRYSGSGTPHRCRILKQPRLP